MPVPLPVPELPFEEPPDFLPPFFVVVVGSVALDDGVVVPVVDVPDALEEPAPLPVPVPIVGSEDPVVPVVGFAPVVPLGVEPLWPDGACAPGTVVAGLVVLVSVVVGVGVAPVVFVGEFAG